MHGTRNVPLDSRGISAFLGIAFGLAWLLDLPIWLSGQGLGPRWELLLLLRNFAPLIATILVVRWLSPVPVGRQVVDLRRGAPGVPWLRYWLACWASHCSTSPRRSSGLCSAVFRSTWACHALAWRPR